MNDAGDFGFDFSGIKAYSGYYLDSQKLKESASGGIASAIAEGFISDGGVVFGVTYSPDFRNAEYCCVERLEDLKKIKGSKYITSKKEVFLDGEYRSVYKVLQEKLEKGYKVLFIGLGCDVGAVRQNLKVQGINTDKLYTIDLICHGPMSPKVASQFLDTLEKKYGSKVIDFNVRYKKTGWVPPYIRAVFESGEVFEQPFYDTDYGKAFSILSREACFHCKYRGESHESDITVGDYWGMIQETPEYNKYGVSILFLNREEKGNVLLDLIDRNAFYLQEADIVRALKGNTNYFKCRTKPDNYDGFVNNFEQQGLHYAVMHSMGAKTRAKYMLKKVLPKSVTDVLKK